MARRTFGRRPALAAALAAALLAGCASLPSGLAWPGRAGGGRGLSQEELGDELNAFATRFSALVSTAGEEIADATDDPAVRRRALLWSLRLGPAVQEAAFAPSPQAGYVRALTISVMLRRYLTTGDGRNLFGAGQPIAVSAAEAIEADALALGARFLTPEELKAVRQDVDQLAERYPIQGTQFSLVRARKAQEAVPASSALTNAITLPLAPFRALQGVDAGAAAVRDFNQTARRFATIVSQLPEDLRGEMQLLLFDAEQLRAVRQGLAAFEQASASAERASLAMERLPDDLRAAIDQDLGPLLERSEGALGQAAQAIGQARELSGALRETAVELREASALWREILGPNDPSPRGPDDRPFDVREWESAARAIGAATVELRGLAAELRALPGSGGLDAVFWRALALLVAFFALLLAYRALAARVLRRG